MELLKTMSIFLTIVNISMYNNEISAQKQVAKKYDIDLVLNRCL